ncbi:hypothetical protein ECD62_03580, partial [Acinetobacter baumannii]|nr:hypothetical protein [Acinetobacter baumannii]
DASNLGANYHFELPSATKVDLAYFATDGGNYHGSSKDSARYTNRWRMSNGRDRIKIGVKFYSNAMEND